MPREDKGLILEPPLGSHKVVKIYEYDSGRGKIGDETPP